MQSAKAIATTLQAPGVPCELGSPLIYGVDYICTYLANSHTIRIVPLKVLKSSQGYMLVVTESLKDTLGRAIKGSGSWELVRQNILSNRLQIPELVPLQKIVNYMVAVLEPVGIQRDKLSYAAYFSTQSAGDVLQTIKRQQIAAYAKKYTQTMAQLGDASAALEEASQLLPSIEIDNSSQPQSAFDALFTQLFSHDYRAQLASVGLTNCNALVTAIADVDNAQYDLAVATFAIAGPYCSTSL
ncbi:hypothetical protein RS130_15825 [Paraglaciecola aquimarina]|uniref:Bacterial virulence factor lipase N-terminal domain-containing protein n=1 Tax=Paraglaciecola aquimarina TaxID=1235557 RepID=A0ABU3SYV0_9ALTE|nr:hypothetical protein [Paraglaciecola aquimarina]MDU0355175.1 hypothetical protein [Paraglaciecola aquimarina]